MDTSPARCHTTTDHCSSRHGYACLSQCRVLFGTAIRHPCQRFQQCHCWTLDSWRLACIRYRVVMVQVCRRNAFFGTSEPLRRSRIPCYCCSFIGFCTASAQAISVSLSGSLASHCFPVPVCVSPCLIVRVLLSKVRELGRGVRVTGTST
jgi:hypothetical protein